MNNRLVRYGILCGLFLQFTVLVMEYVNAVYPLWTGQEVLLRTVPVDPRSLFRGNYARLNYEISQIPASSFENIYQPRVNEFIYVSLQQDKAGIYELSGASMDRPGSGVFIRGRVQEDQGDTFRIKYGIEAYFAPEEKALMMERELRDKAIARVMLAKNGKAALQEIITLQE